MIAVIQYIQFADHRVVIGLSDLGRFRLLFDATMGACQAAATLSFTALERVAISLIAVSRSNPLESEQDYPIR